MRKTHYIPITADVPGAANDANCALIRRTIRTALAAEGFTAPCEVDVLLTDDDGIHEINRELRQVDRPTDVLSFPEFELTPGQLPDPEDADPGTGLIPLGDMVLSLERVRAQESGKEALAALSSGWAAQEVTFEAGNGWVMGLHGAVFSKEQALSRAELAEILNRILGRTPQSLSDLLVGMPLFSDNLDTEAAYFLAMQEAAIDHTAYICGDGERWTGLG